MSDFFNENTVNIRKAVLKIKYFQKKLNKLMKIH